MWRTAQLKDALAPLQFLLAGSLGFGLGYIFAPLFFYVEPDARGNPAQLVIGLIVGLVSIAICQIG